MSGLDGISTQGVNALVQWGLQTGIAVSLLIIFVLIIRRHFARYFGANAAYALWVLPLIRVFTPPITVPFLRKTSPQGPPVEPINTPPHNVPATQSRPDAMPSSESLEVIASAASNMPVFNYMGVLGIIWLSIALLWFGFQLTKQARFGKAILAESKAPSDSLLSAIKEAVASVGLNRHPIIRLSSTVSGPMVSGITKPFIVLPLDFETRFNASQQHFALVHEMAHIKRKDLWVALLSLGFRALFWPNPLVHYAAHKLRTDQEAACDASVIARTGGDKVTHFYAQTLIHAAKGVTDKTSHKSKQTPLGLALMEVNFNKETDR